MKSMVYGAMEALNAQLEARSMLRKILESDVAAQLKLEHQWTKDLQMLNLAQPFAWGKESVDAVLHASQSIPLDTELNFHNLGTEAIWWHFEEPLPFITTHAKVGIRAFCMAPIAESVVYPKGSPIEFVQSVLRGEKSHYDTPLNSPPPKIKPIYGVSCWTDHSGGMSFLWPGHTFQWTQDQTIEHLLFHSDLEHDRAYGPNGRFKDAQTIGKEAFLIATENMAKFILAGLVWIKQRVLVANEVNIERHARKRLEREVKHRPELRLVQLRKTDHVRKDNDSPEKREYSCRFIVEGHWRNQRVGVGHSQTRLTWVQPYVKGPDDKPLVVPQKKVYVVNR